MPSVIINNENHIPNKFRGSFKPLVEKINGLASVSICKHLSGGFSESVPLPVYATYDHTSTYQVFKIGQRDIIDAEAQNWNNFIKNGPYDDWNVIHLKQHIPGSPYSLIVYNFAGQPSKEPITFEHLYKENKNPEDALKYLFEEVLRPLSVRRGSDHPQILDFFRTISRNPARITEEVERLSGFKGVSAKPKIKINGTEFYNPLHFCPFNNNSPPPNKIAIPIPQGIVHGDLHAGNMLFYPAGALKKEGIKKERITVEIPCIIDYAHTGEKSLYTDIARLESVLKFQLLKVDSVRPNVLLQFEQENILCALTPSNKSPVTDPHLQKLFSSIEVLREIASRIIDSDKDYGDLGFWLELYKNTLLHVKYDISDSQKRYAFISASIILTRYFMKITAFKIPEKIKHSPDYLLFPLRPSTVERPAHFLLQEDVLKAYKEYIKHRREHERRLEFPKDTRFIEPTMRLRVKMAPERRMPSHQAGTGEISHQKEIEFKSISLKELMKEKGNFVLIADSGLGKTTLIKELQYQLVTGILPTEKIPIYFHFRDLLGVFSAEALLERIKDLFPKEITRDHIESTINALFKQKRLIFLLDGLDQVEDRSNIPRLLDRYGILSSHSVILAGRPYIYSSLQNELSHYQYLTLETFST